MRLYIKSTNKITFLLKIFVIIMSLIFACIITGAAEEIDIDPVIISANDIIISNNGNAVSTIQINNATHLAIVSLHITWDPAVINLSVFDSSMSPFDIVQKSISNVNGYIYMDAYAFANGGLQGNLTICNLTFSASQQAHHGDWCPINFSNCIVWNVYNCSEPEQDIVEVPSLTINATAFINAIDLDICQLESDRGFPIRHAADGDWGAAQSIIPTRDVLTNFSILIGKFGSPDYDLIVEFRKDEIDGELLDSIVFDLNSIPEGKFWLNVDIEDNMIESGSMYYIILPSPPSYVSTSYGYEWAYAYENHYTDGSFWFTRNGGTIWRDLPSMYDFTFQLYGYNQS